MIRFNWRHLVEDLTSAVVIVGFVAAALSLALGLGGAS
jgi:hypothetical protein